MQKGKISDAKRQLPATKFYRQLSPTTSWGISWIPTRQSNWDGPSVKAILSHCRIIDRSPRPTDKQFPRRTAHNETAVLWSHTKSVSITLTYSYLVPILKSEPCDPATYVTRLSNWKKSHYSTTAAKTTMFKHWKSRHIISFQRPCLWII